MRRSGTKTIMWIFASSGVLAPNDAHTAGCLASEKCSRFSYHPFYALSRASAGTLAAQIGPTSTFPSTLSCNPQTRSAETTTPISMDHPAPIDPRSPGVSRCWISRGLFDPWRENWRQSIRMNHSLFSVRMASNQSVRTRTTEKVLGSPRPPDIRRQSYFSDEHHRSSTMDVPAAKAT